MALFTIDREKCTRDGLCVAECPRLIIKLNDDSPVPVPTADAEEKCINCGHCVAVCPRGALSLTRMKAADCPKIDRDLTVTVAQAAQFLRSRRSIRSYQDKPVERETIEMLIDMARYAPTGTNSQRVNWKVFDSPGEVKKLAGMVVDFLRHVIAAKHPMADAYDLSGIVKAWESGYDGIGRGAPALVVTHSPKDYPLATVDCAIALTYLDLAAPTLGLGTCWGGFFMMTSAQWPPLQNALELPEGHACFDMMMLGYPKMKYRRLPLRNSPPITWK